MPELIHQLFQQQSRRDPNKIAVEHSGQKITYQQLNERASSLADELALLGVTNETLCGLCLAPSIDAIAAMLGILQANAAFVPIDPELPQERISFLVKGAQLQYMIGDRGVTNYGEGLRGVSDARNSSFFIRNYSPLAYVLYTSGSTGVPKGVMIEHRSLCALIEAERAAFDFQPSDRVLQFASLSFDVSVYEIFAALLSGATLCIPTKEARRPGPALLGFLQDEKITIATLLPPVLASLQNRDLPHLRTIVTGGEPLPQTIVDDWARGRRFFNAYGPTEATIGATVFECKPREEVNIGRPLPHVSIYLLDEEMRPVQEGEKGEIYIGGVGVGRGYLFDPIKTQERFLKNPFGEGRLYKTGDIGRLRPDGELDFLGRLDEQIKHRGFRIELGEIEHAILQCQAVKEAAVIFEGELLIAFYLGEATAQELKESLAQKLPPYMIPQRFIFLNEPPLTINGKWDKAALRAMELSHQRLLSLSKRPLLLPLPADTEQRLGPVKGSSPAGDALKIAALFAEVLSRQSFSIDDNFFEMGGDSLLAAKLLFRLQQELQSEVMLKAFFEDPRPRALASLVTQPSVESIKEEVAVLARGLPTLPDVEPQSYVILTGATGYLGIFLLRELQRRGEQVLCLVKANSLEEAQRRLRQNAEGYHVEIDLEGLQVALFDLAKPLLTKPLPPKKMYHAAARVDLLRPYSALKRENLYGTASLLSLCAKETQLHYISTQSATSYVGGYAQSKWAAELLVKSAGLCWSITRPVLIAGHSEENIINPNDLFYALLQESLRQQQFPALTFDFDLVFVDELARQICEITSGEHNVQSQQPVSCQDIADELQIKLVPYPLWRANTCGDSIGRHLAYLDSIKDHMALLEPSAGSLMASSREVLRRYIRRRK